MYNFDLIRAIIVVKFYPQKVDGKQLLEEQMRNLKANQEQNVTLEQLAKQLRDIEAALERKTRTLESLHAGIASESCSSPSEDVSIRGQIPAACEDVSPRSTSSLLPVDEVQRILEKLAKHSRAEEAAIKRIHDLEMQISGVRANFAVSLMENCYYVYQRHSNITISLAVCHHLRGFCVGYPQDRKCYVRFF